MIVWGQAEIKNKFHVMGVENGTLIKSMPISQHTTNGYAIFQAGYAFSHLPYLCLTTTMSILNIREMASSTPFKEDITNMQ